MARAMDVGGTEWEYVLEDDLKLPAEERTTWRFKTLTHKERLRLERKQLSGVSIVVNDMEVSGDGKTIKANPDMGNLGDLRKGEDEHKLRILGSALIGVDNFRDGNGAEQSVKRKGQDVLHPDFVDRISPYVDELATAAWTGSIITVEQAKNSTSPSVPHGVTSSTSDAS